MAKDKARESGRHEACESPVCYTKGLSLHPLVPSGGGDGDGSMAESHLCFRKIIMPNM